MGVQTRTMVQGSDSCNSKTISLRYCSQVPDSKSCSFSEWKQWDSQSSNLCSTDNETLSTLSYRIPLIQPVNGGTPCLSSVIKEDFVSLDLISDVCSTPSAYGMMNLSSAFLFSSTASVDNNASIQSELSALSNGFLSSDFLNFFISSFGDSDTVSLNRKLLSDNDTSSQYNSTSSVILQILKPYDLNTLFESVGWVVLLDLNVNPTPLLDGSTSTGNFLAFTQLFEDSLRSHLGGSNISPPKFLSLSAEQSRLILSISVSEIIQHVLLHESSVFQSYQSLPHNLGGEDDSEFLLERFLESLYGLKNSSLWWDQVSYFKLNSTQSLLFNATICDAECLIGRRDTLFLNATANDKNNLMLPPLPGVDCVSGQTPQQVSVNNADACISLCILKTLGDCVCSSIVLSSPVFALQMEPVAADITNEHRWFSRSYYSTYNDAISVGGLSPTVGFICNIHSKQLSSLIFTARTTVSFIRRDGSASFTEWTDWQDASPKACSGDTSRTRVRSCYPSNPGSFFCSNLIQTSLMRPKIDQCGTSAFSCTSMGFWSAWSSCSGSDGLAEFNAFFNDVRVANDALRWSKRVNDTLSRKTKRFSVPNGIQTRLILNQNGCVQSHTCSEFAGGITQVGTGWGHSCALNDVGVVSCWGDNQWGQLGGGTDAGGIVWPPSYFNNGNDLVSDLVDRLLVDGNSTCVTTVNKFKYCWGRDSRGRRINGWMSTFDVNISWISPFCSMNEKNLTVSCDRRQQIQVNGQLVKTLGNGFVVCWLGDNLTDIYCSSEIASKFIFFTVRSLGGFILDFSITLINPASNGDPQMLSSYLNPNSQVLCIDYLFYEISTCGQKFSKSTSAADIITSLSSLSCTPRIISRYFTLQNIDGIISTAQEITTQFSYRQETQINVGLSLPYQWIPARSRLWFPLQRRSLPSMSNGACCLGLNCTFASIQVTIGSLTPLPGQTLRASRRVTSISDCVASVVLYDRVYSLSSELLVFPEMSPWTIPYFLSNSSSTKSVDSSLMDVNITCWCKPVFTQSISNPLLLSNQTGSSIKTDYVISSVIPYIADPAASPPISTGSILSVNSYIEDDLILFSELSGIPTSPSPDWQSYTNIKSNITISTDSMGSILTTSDRPLSSFLGSWHSNMVGSMNGHKCIILWPSPLNRVVDNLNATLDTQSDDDGTRATALSYEKGGLLRCFGNNKQKQLGTIIRKRNVAVNEAYVRSPGEFDASFTELHTFMDDFWFSKTIG